LDPDLTHAGLLHELSVLKWRSYQLTIAAIPTKVRKALQAIIETIERAEERIRGYRENRPRQLQNLITVEGEPSLIFLQLAVYAIRAGLLEREDKDGCFLRFAERFRNSVGYLGPDQRQGASLKVIQDSILFQSWEAVLRGYCLPSRNDAFMRYARYIIAKIKRSELSRDQDRAMASGSSVRAVAARTGTPERTIYHLIDTEQLSVTTTGGQIEITLEGEEQLRQRQATKKQRKDLQATVAELLVKQTGPSLESTKRRIRRYRQQGLPEPQIARRIGEAFGLIPDTEMNDHNSATKD